MEKKLYYILVGILFILSGCQEEILNSRQQENQLETVYVTTSAVIKSRVHLSTDNTVIWDSWDVIGIYSDKQPDLKPYNYVSSTGNSAEFSAEGDNVQGNEFYAVYPYDSSFTSQGNIITINLPDYQDYWADSFDPTHCPMVARSTDGNFRFLQTTGLIRLKLTGSMNLNKIILEGNNNEGLCGIGTIDINSSEPVFSLAKETAQTRVSMKLPILPLNKEQETSFYFIVPVQTFSKGLTFTIIGSRDDGTSIELKKTTSNPVTITRSVITSFTGVDVDEELNNEDLSQKEALIALYDATDGNNWTNNTNWCTEADLTEWYGIRCDYYGNIISLDLSNNNLTGQIPEEISQLTSLYYIYLSNNSLSGPIPESFYKLSNLRYCYLYNNKLTGALSPQIGNLSQLEYANISGNQLSGTVPEELKNLTSLISFIFSDNYLSGELPLSVTSTPWWQQSGWRNIEQNGTGFTIESVNLSMPSFIMQDIQGNTVNSSETIASHEVTLYYIWATWCGYSQMYHPTVSSVYQKYKNHGLAIIGACYDGEENRADALEYIASNQMEWPTLPSMEAGIDCSGFPTIMAFNKTGKLIFHSSIQNRDSLPEFLQSILGEGDLPYESTDFSTDGEIFTLQTATEGNGINLILMGDGFSDRQIADGTYKETMLKGMEAFFSEQPYTYFHTLFNVYYVNAVSKNEGYIDNGETVFSCYFGGGTNVGGDDQKCMEYAKKCGLSDDDINDALIIVMMNSTKNAGTCYMYYSTAYLGDYGRGCAIAYFPIGNTETQLKNVLQHEAGGHGFAKLADEYYYEDLGTIPSNRVDTNLYLRTNFGWYKNVDYTSSSTDVFWNKFITDTRYVNDKVGVYEGGATYPYGAYRPTENSIMRYNEGGFNAPSREAIYYRIHKLAYGTNWTYNFEDFVAWDEVYGMPSFTAARASRVKSGDFKPTPPIVKKGYWSNGHLNYY